jgi:SAM-dependent methyltransferase
VTDVALPPPDLVEVMEFPSLEEIEFGDVLALSLSSRTNELTHGLHRFPAKYIPQVPRWALREFARPGDVVLDPFLGSGTTSVEAASFPVASVGVEFDPLALEIARAKADPPASADVEAAWRAVMGAWRDAAPKASSLPMAGVENDDHWFDIDTRRSLAGLLAAVDAVDPPADVRRFLLILVSSVLRRVSRADDQSMKTYVSGTNPKTPPSVEEVLSPAYERALAGLREFEARRHAAATPAQIIGGDARDLPLPDASVDLVITSPPYLDSVDYQYNAMVEYFWLGPTLGVADRRSWNELRRRATGAKRPLVAEVEIPAAVRELVDVKDVAPARAQAVSTYLSDLDRHFKEAARCVRPGGRYVLVIGNSSSERKLVPVHDCLVRLAQANGFALENAFGYRLRRHYMKFPRNGRGGIILIDWIVVLQRVDRPIDSPKRLPQLQWRLPPDAVAH